MIPHNDDLNRAVGRLEGRFEEYTAAMDIRMSELQLSIKDSHEKIYTAIESLSSEIKQGASPRVSKKVWLGGGGTLIGGLVAVVEWIRRSSS